VIVDDGVVGKSVVRDGEWREIEHGWLICEKMEIGSMWFVRNVNITVFNTLF
jgi:hypothetical protein